MSLTNEQKYVITSLLKTVTGNRLTGRDARKLVDANVTDDMAFSPLAVRTLLQNLKSSDAPEIRDDYMEHIVNNNDRLRQFVTNEMNATKARYRQRAKLDNDLRRELQPYTTRFSLTSIENGFDVPKDAEGRPIPMSNHQLQRTRDLLTFLNNEHIHFTLGLLDEDRSKIVANLDEYGKSTRVTIASPDAQQIGTVYTENSILTTDSRNEKELPSTTVLRTVLDTKQRLQVKNLSTFYTTSGNQQKHFASYQMEGVEGSIFVVNTNRMMKSRKEVSEELADAALLTPESLTDDPNEETVTRDKITSADVAQELLNRQANEYRQVDPNDRYATMIQDNLDRFGVSDPRVYINPAGTYKYTYKLEGDKKARSAFIGGIVPENDQGVYPMTVNGKEKGTYVPGLRGYIDTETGELRVKPFDKIFQERLHSVMTEQLINPTSRTAISNYTIMDNLYSSDTYGTMVTLGVNSPEIEQAIVATLKGKLRLSNELLSTATTFNEDRNVQQAPINELDRIRNEGNLRVIDPAWYPVIDREMTSIGKNQGGVLFLGDKTTITDDGRLVAGEGVTVAKAPVHQLSQFDFNEFDPVDRNIMGFAQFLRNVPVTEGKLALMPFGGWVTNDSYVISKEWAQANGVIGEDGQPRDLMVGDKLTDFHGNKGTISLIVDRESDDPKLQQEIAIFKANPDLDLVASAHSQASRFNAGTVREMQHNGVEPVAPVIERDADGKERVVIQPKATKGTVAMMVSDMTVDHKTTIYTPEMVENGRGRKISHQLTACIAALNGKNTLTQYFGPESSNKVGWGKFVDDLNMLGYDIDKHQRLGRLNPAELAKRSEIIQPQPNVAFKDALKVATERAEIHGKDRIALALPQFVNLKSGVTTDLIQVPKAQFDAQNQLNSQLGVAKGHYESKFIANYRNLYNAALSNDKNALQRRVDTLAVNIQDMDFSSKHNVVKDSVFNAVAKNSATAVVTPDPTLDIDTLKVSPAIYENFQLAHPDDKILAWRDPSLRSGAVRAFQVEVDDKLTGVAIHPANDKSMEMDHDGDSLGLTNEPNRMVQHEWATQFMPSQNLIDPVSAKGGSYLETGLDVQAGIHQLKRPEYAEQLANPSVTKDEVNHILHETLRTPVGFETQGIVATNDDTVKHSLEQIVESGAKGKASSIEEYMHYYNHERSDQDIQDWQFALGAKVDMVGPAGSLQQRMIVATRNSDIAAALEITRGATQAALQSKHDPVQARVTKNVLTKDLPNVYAGFDRYSRSQKDRIPLSRDEFVNQLNEINNDEAGLNQRLDVIERLADSLTDQEGMIMDERSRLAISDPLDRIAYGGLRDLTQACDRGEQVGVGEWTKLFQAPESLLADEITLPDKYDYSKPLQEIQVPQLESEVETDTSLQDDVDMEL